MRLRVWLKISMALTLRLISQAHVSHSSILFLQLADLIRLNAPNAPPREVLLGHIVVVVRVEHFCGVKPNAAADQGAARVVRRCESAMCEMCDKE